MTLNKRNLLKMQFLPLYIDYITFLSGEKNGTYALTPYSIASSVDFIRADLM